MGAVVGSKPREMSPKQAQPLDTGLESEDTSMKLQIQRTFR